jgi:hypothetical protein
MAVTAAAARHGSYCQQSVLTDAISFSHLEMERFKKIQPKSRCGSDGRMVRGRRGSATIVRAIEHLPFLKRKKDFFFIKMPFGVFQSGHCTLTSPMFFKTPWCFEK